MMKKVQTQSDNEMPLKEKPMRVSIIGLASLFVSFSFSGISLSASHYHSGFGGHRPSTKSASNVDDHPRVELILESAIQRS